MNISTSVWVGGKLGNGGSGTVYQSALNSKVPKNDDGEPKWDSATKFITRSNDTAGLNRELQYLKRLQFSNAIIKLKHPFLVKDMQNPGHIGLSMEIAVGTLKHQMPNTPDQVLAFSRNIFSALTALRKAEIVHRDIKPDNILAVNDEAGRLIYRLSDFGISTYIGAKQTYSGSFYYIAPEVRLTIGTTQPAQDVFSAGIVLSEVIFWATDQTKIRSVVHYAGELSAADDYVSVHHKNLTRQLDTVVHTHQELSETISMAQTMVHPEPQHRPRI